MFYKLKMQNSEENTQRNTNHLYGISIYFPEDKIEKVENYDFNGNLFTGTLYNDLPERDGKIIYTKRNATFEGKFTKGKIQD